MWKYNNTDELYHYGVIGMRWGVRRARRNGSDYTYKSHGQKKWEKKSAGSEARDAKAAAKASNKYKKKSVDYDQKMAEAKKAGDMKKASKYEAKSTQNMNKANAAINKGSSGRTRVAKEKYETYKLRDKNRQDYVETTGVGRSIVKTALFGPFGNGNYNRFRASGHSRLYSAVGSNIVFSTLGLPVTVLFSRSSEKSAAQMRKRGYDTN